MPAATSLSHPLLNEERRYRDPQLPGDGLKIGDVERNRPVKPAVQPGVVVTQPFGQFPDAQALSDHFDPERQGDPLTEAL